MSNMIVSLAQHELHLWVCHYNEVNDKTSNDVYRGLLDEQESAQEARFQFEKDQRRYLITRAMVRAVLSRYEQVDPKDWRFSVNSYGRPEIANHVRGDLVLVFNISHTQGLIGLGVANKRMLGVDVENVLARQAPIASADHFFSPSEVSALRRVRPSEQQDRFFEYWTFKESYIKARGMGLSIPLDKFSFFYPRAGSVQISIHPDLADDPKRWQFWQFRPTPEYLVAVCAERVEARTTVVVKKVVPMFFEQTLAPLFLRMSN